MGEVGDNDEQNCVVRSSHMNAENECVVEPTSSAERTEAAQCGSKRVPVIPDLCMAARSDDTPQQTTVQRSELNDDCCCNIRRPLMFTLTSEVAQEVHRWSRFFVCGTILLNVINLTCHHHLKSGLRRLGSEGKGLLFQEQLATRLFVR